jgi:hypothetical protein
LGNTGIALRYDILLITRLESGVTTTKPYLITSIVDDVTVAVSPFGGADGDAVSFPAGTTATIRWVQPVEVLGGHNAYDGHVTPVAASRWSSLMLIDPNRNLGQQAPDAGYQFSPAQFYGALENQKLMSLGYFEPLIGGFTEALSVGSGGGIDQKLGYFSGSVRHRTFTDATFIGNNAVMYVTMNGYNYEYFYVEASGIITITFEDAPSDRDPPVAGFCYVFVVDNHSAGASVTITGPANWIFGDDGTNTDSVPENAVRMYIVRWFNMLGPTVRALVEIREYPQVT